MKKQVIAILIIALVLISLIGLYYANAKTTGSVVKIQSSSNTLNEEDRVINIDASRFSYSPEVIRVKKGEKVRIIINNLDTTHGIYIPELGVNGIGEVEFTPNQTGTFVFRCPTMCGPGHKEMEGTLIVE